MAGRFLPPLLALAAGLLVAGGVLRQVAPEGFGGGSEALRSASAPASSSAMTAPPVEVGSAAAADDPWSAYVSRFVRPDGRVVDTGNEGITHSEAQAWGMLLATAADDRATFERIWDWTRENLQWQGARLFAWKWDPEAEPSLIDANVASDGDLMIAWALERAGRIWGRPDWSETAAGIARDLRHLVVTPVGHRLVLLPGFEGFEREDSVVVNLSYYAFPALQALTRVDPDPAWTRVIEDGLELLETARTPPVDLPPDWIQVAEDDAVAPADDWPARFGYEAIRIPLYLAMSDLGTPERLEPFRSFWSSLPPDEAPPNWVDLESGALAPESDPVGYAAIRALIMGDAETIAHIAGHAAEAHYYPASLALLSWYAPEFADDAP